MQGLQSRKKVQEGCAGAAASLHLGSTDLIQRRQLHGAAVGGQLLCRFPGRAWQGQGAVSGLHKRPGAASGGCSSAAGPQRRRLTPDLGLIVLGLSAAVHLELQLVVGALMEGKGG